jgi:membrane-bound serine protease (ClpP class)
MNPLYDPNISYLLLVSGLIFTSLALISPGTGVLEIGAVFAIILAGFGIYNLPLNAWALAILLFGVVAFYFSLRHAPRWLFLIVAAIALVTGSIFLFRVDESSTGVHPVLAVISSLGALGLMWWVGSKSLEAIAQAPAHDLTQLLLMQGRAVTDIFTDGTVYVDSEEWTARSEVAIPAGSLVKIVKRDGLLLQVAPIEDQQSGSTHNLQDLSS